MATNFATYSVDNDVAVRDASARIQVSEKEQVVSIINGDLTGLAAVAMSPEEVVALARPMQVDAEDGAKSIVLNRAPNAPANNIDSIESSATTEYLSVNGRRVRIEHSKKPGDLFPEMSIDVEYKSAGKHGDNKVRFVCGVNTPIRGVDRNEELSKGKYYAYLEVTIPTGEGRTGKVIILIGDQNEVTGYVYGSGATDAYFSAELARFLGIHHKLKDDKKSDTITSLQWLDQAIAKIRSMVFSNPVYGGDPQAAVRNQTLEYLREVEDSRQAKY